MRWLDFWVGVPACALLTLVNAVLRAIRPQREPKDPPRHVLFIGLAEMGAVVLADPALRRVRDHHGATPLFVTFAHNRNSLRLIATVDEADVFCLRVSGPGVLLADLIRFRRWARRRGVGAVVDLELFARFSAMLALMSGASLRVGLHCFAGEGVWRGNLFTRRVRYDPDLPMARSFLTLAEAAFVPPTASGAVPMPCASPLSLPTRRIPAAERREAEERIAGRFRPFDRHRHRLVLVHPNIGDLLPQRRWPRTHHIDLIRRILDRYPDVVVALMGPPSEHDAVAAMAAEIGSPRCIAIAGLFTVAELPALFACSALLITSDSGPAHFAAVAALPVVVLFGPETPRRYRPLGPAVALTAGLPCSPCFSAANQRRAGCTAAPCMSAIPVDAVWGPVRQILGSPACLQTAAATADPMGAVRRTA